MYKLTYYSRKEKENVLKFHFCNCNIKKCEQRTKNRKEKLKEIKGWKTCIRFTKKQSE